MTIILLEIENNRVETTLILNKKLEKQINTIIKGVNRNFININIEYQDKWYSCLIIKNRIAYIYLNEPFEKCGLTIFLNDLYHDYLVHTN